MFGDGRCLIVLLKTLAVMMRDVTVVVLPTPAAGGVCNCALRAAHSLVCDLAPAV